MSIFDPKKSKRPPPPWLRWLMIGFIALAILNGYRAEKGLDENAPRIDDYPAFAEFISVGNWRKQLNPDLGKLIQTQEIEAGEGIIALCGQKVTLVAAPIALEDRALPENFSLPAQPITFTIGDGSAPELLDRAVRGMQAGGIRKILAGAWLIDDSLDPDTLYPFELNLKTIEPSLPKPADFSEETLIEGKGSPALCGDTIHLRLISPDEMAHETALTLGQNTLGHGIDRAALGMRVGEVKQVSLPRAFLPQDAANFPFQISQKTLVKLERLPYTEAENLTPSTEEPAEHEPDR